MQMEKAVISDFVSPVEKFGETRMDDLEYQSYLKGRVLLIALFFLNNCLMRKHMEDPCAQELLDKQYLLQLMQNLANFKSGSEMMLHTAKIVHFIETHDTPDTSNVSKELVKHLTETSRAMSDGPSPRGSLVHRIVASTILR
jgi:hypothetical protein